MTPKQILMRLAATALLFLALFVALAISHMKEK